MSLVSGSWPVQTTTGMFFCAAWWTRAWMPELIGWMSRASGFCANRSCTFPTCFVASPFAEAYASLTWFWFATYRTYASDEEAHEFVGPCDANAIVYGPLFLYLLVST